MVRLRVLGAWAGVGAKVVRRSDWIGASKMCSPLRRGLRNEVQETPGLWPEPLVGRCCRCEMVETQEEQQ